jgi:mannose/cellobiose epimerase-like protein (N-acyl-D-glucosamine 2-epimerase family)
MHDADLVGLNARLMGWLLNDALPLWWDVGADRAAGGFHESIDHDGRPAGDVRRARVQARQIFSYAVARELQWSGPSRQAIDHGLDYFLSRYRRRDGFFYNALGSDERPSDTEPYLYEQAFALLALATASGAESSASSHQAVALTLLDRLQRDRRGSAGGYTGFPDRELFQSDPHMHLFEAAMAWERVSDDPCWRELADEIAELCLAHFMTDRGVLLEYFDATWAPARGLAGRIASPGHQFEWAGLLERWALARGREDVRGVARRLYRFGADHGIDPVRGVAVMELLDDLSIHEARARLWPQTEWLKAAVIMARSEADEERRQHYVRDAASAARALLAYLDVPVAGLWRDGLLSDGRWIEEPAPASSFYHIIDALRVLNDWNGATMQAGWGTRIRT